MPSESRNGSEDQLVFVSIKIVVNEQVAHSIPGRIVKQQTSQHTRLSLNGVRRDAQLRNLLILTNGAKSKIGFRERLGRKKC
jgi:hypothetical protein